MLLHSLPAIAAALCAFFGLAALPPAQAEEPSLSETLAWMDSTYNSHQSAGGAFGHGREESSVNGKTFKRRTEFFTYDGCQISLHIEDDPTAPLFSEMYSSMVDTLNLRDVDPTSIKTRLFASQYGGISCDFDPVHLICDMAEIDFETRNQAPLISTESHHIYPKLQGSDHESGGKGTSFTSWFVVDNVEYAARFAKAFRHAVALCGGKPSAF
jgi:hypothetical protein